MIEKKDLKVCMFLQRKAALWGHALALELKELGVAQFSAYASPFRSAEFLRAQHDIAYQPLLVDEEIIANFKDEKITPRERSAGIRAYNMSKRGAYITKNTGYGSGYVDRTHYWGSPNEFSGSDEFLSSSHSGGGSWGRN